MLLQPQVFEQSLFLLKRGVTSPLFVVCSQFKVEVPSEHQFPPIFMFGKNP